MKKLAVLITLLLFGNIGLAASVPVVEKVNPKYLFKYNTYPNDVKPFLLAILNGDKEAGIEIQYRLSMDVAINVERAGKENVDPVAELNGVEFRYLFGERSPSVNDVNSLARYLAFSLKRGAILELEHRNKALSGFSYSPFSLFNYYWCRLAEASIPAFNVFYYLFPIFRFPILPNVISNLPF